MNKKETIWNQVAQSQAAMKELARSVKVLWKTLDKLPQDELVKIFIAICKAGEEYDPNMRYREKLIGLIRDEFLPEFLGLKVPISLAWQIEKRFWIVERKPPFPDFSGNVDITEVKG